MKLLFMMLLVFHSPDAYEKAMKSALKQMDAVSSMDDMREVANTFGRITEVETEKWHAAYYASYTWTVVAANEEDPAKRDQLLDQAQQYLDKTMSMEKDESEVAALQGFIYMIRIGVDPATRGQSYSMKSAQSLQLSKSINPENPRSLFMLAQLSYGTAQFFGSDTSEACGMNEKALQLFDKGPASADPFAPTWGKEQSLQFKERCNN